MRRKPISFAVALVAMLLVAAACGDSDDGRVAAELDEAAVNALVEHMSAAQASVTSSLTETYMTAAMSSPGEPDVAVDDVPVKVATTVGDLVHLVHLETDGFAMTDTTEEGGGSGPADAPWPEMVIEGDTRLYVNLGAFADLDLTADSPLLAGLDADSPLLAGLDTESGYDVGDLWGFVDFANLDRAPPNSWVHLGMGMTPSIVTEPLGLGEDVPQLLARALADGALLEARSGERTQVMGVDTMPYSFVIDLVDLSERPNLLGDLGSEALAAFEASLDGLPSPLPIRYTVHLDDEGVDRRTVVEVDMGAILTATSAAFDELDGVSEGEASEFPEIEYHVAVRLDTHSINDPALTVTLPDPSRVIDLLSMPLFSF